MVRTRGHDGPMLGGSTYAFVPARGGSKGIPQKNVRTVGGVPLVVRAVVAARAALTVDRVVVSTDDDTIASLARESGAEVIERPAGPRGGRHRVRSGARARAGRAPGPSRARS